MTVGIIGGGIAGLCVGLRLAEEGLRPRWYALGPDGHPRPMFPLRLSEAYPSVLRLQGSWSGASVVSTALLHRGPPGSLVDQCLEASLEAYTRWYSLGEVGGAHQGRALVRSHPLVIARDGPRSVAPGQAWTVDLSELCHLAYQSPPGEGAPDWWVHTTGAALGRDPWTRHIPLKPARGTWLELDLGPESRSLVWLGKRHLVPRPGGTWAWGSTVDWDSGVLPPRQADYLTLKADWESCQGDLDSQGVMAVGARILGIHGGFRPAAPDRLPIIGELEAPGHPVPGPAGQGRHLVINGLGSRGFALAPVLADLAVAYIVRGMPLPTEWSPLRKSLRR